MSHEHLGDVVMDVRAAHFTYLERFPALVDVNFAVRAGERVALLGANGCGKSTLLRVLAGLTFVDRGEYRAFGQSITEESLTDEGVLKGFRSRVGVIFQNSDAQVFSASVREEIAFGCLQLGMSADETEERVRESAELLGVDSLLDRTPFHLSGGQKKRVAIASVLVMNPHVILLDEPTAALDPRSSTALVEILDEIHRAGKTIVTATHDLASLPDIAERAVVFSEEHQVLLDAPVEQVISDRELLVRANVIAPSDALSGSRR